MFASHWIQGSARVTQGLQDHAVARLAHAFPRGLSGPSFQAEGNAPGLPTRGHPSTWEKPPHPHPLPPPPTPSPPLIPSTPPPPRPGEAPVHSELFAGLPRQQIEDGAPGRALGRDAVSGRHLNVLQPRQFVRPQSATCLMGNHLKSDSCVCQHWGGGAQKGGGRGGWFPFKPS